MSQKNNSKKTVEPIVLGIIHCTAWKFLLKLEVDNICPQVCLCLSVFYFISWNVNTHTHTKQQ